MTCGGGHNVLEGGESFVERLVAELRLHGGERGGRAGPRGGVGGVGGVVDLVLVLDDFDLDHGCRCVGFPSEQSSATPGRRSGNAED